jgi:hypothetical protein
MSLLERAFVFGIFDFLCFALFAYATGSRWEWAPMFAGIYAVSVVAPYRGGRP